MKARPLIIALKKGRNFTIILMSQTDFKTDLQTDVVRQKRSKMKKGNFPRKIKKSSLVIGALLFLIAWTIWSWVPFTERIQIDFKGKDSGKARIALITDLHSCYYGKNQKWLTKRIDRENPDIAILSGDIFDDKIGDENAKILIEHLVKKYPCFYVTGNHEYWSGRADEMKDWLRSKAVSVLDGNCRTISIGGLEFDIAGVDDPVSTTESEWKNQLAEAYSSTDESHIKILVSHRPEKTAAYEKYDFDLILTGHAHSGQFRIPFFNRGLYAPNQGLMAKYVNGLYTLSNGSRMIVSRGLARESTPLPRFFNHPELIILNIN